MPALEGEEKETERENGDKAAKEELERLVKVKQDLRQKVADLSLKVKNGPEQVREISDLRLKREFKISGTISVPGETNKLNFISLVHQIEVALAKGHSEIKVNEAII